MNRDQYQRDNTKIAKRAYNIIVKFGKKTPNKKIEKTMETCHFFEVTNKNPLKISPETSAK